MKLPSLIRNLHPPLQSPRVLLAVIPAILVSLGIVAYAALQYESLLVADDANSTEFTSHPGLGKSSTVGKAGNVAIGNYHSVNSGTAIGHSLALGSFNTISNAHASLANGGINNIHNYWSFASGYGITIPSQSGSGGGYFQGRMPAVAVGTYNSISDHGGKHFLFSVGNGNNSGDTGNALTVYKDGAVVIHQPSSEIPMFGQ